MSNKPRVRVRRQKSILALFSFWLALAGLALVFVPSLCSFGLSTIGAGVLLGIVASLHISLSRGRLDGGGFAAFAIIVAPMVVFGLPVFFLARASTMTINCRNNMEELAVAFDQYAEDHHGLYPPPARWQNELYPYVKDERIFRCPAAKGKLPTYAMNAALAGKGKSDLKDPANTVLIFDSVPGRNLAGGYKLLPREPRHMHDIHIVLRANGEATWFRIDGLHRFPGWGK